MNYSESHPRPAPPGDPRTKILCEYLPVVFPELTEHVGKQPNVFVSTSLVVVERAASSAIRRRIPHLAHLGADTASRFVEELGNGVWLLRFDPAEQTLRAYLSGMFMNCVKTVIRDELRHHRRRRDSDWACVEVKQGLDDTEAEAMKSHRLAAIVRAFQRLEPHKRIALVERYRLLDPSLHGPADRPSRSYVHRSRALGELANDDELIRLGSKRAALCRITFHHGGSRRRGESGDENAS